MKTTVTLLAASALIVGGAGLASAAPANGVRAVKPVCHLVSDAPGDAGPKYNNVPGAAGDDITSADVASNARTLTGVVRTAAVSTTDPQAPFGRAYFVLFTAPGSADQLFLSARTYPEGTTFVYGYEGVDPNTGINTSYTLGDATGVVDPVNKEIRISAPVSGFVAGAKARLAPGVKLSALAATIYRIAGQGFVPSQSPVPGGPRVPVGGLLLPFDTASGGSYRMGTPSCVLVGR